MKTLNLCAVLLFSIFSVNFSFAQTAVKKETIKVWGNCGMCKTTIEKAAKKAGATKASWSEESKELNVSYASSKSSSVKIQKAIAKAGYDTQDFIADNTAYNNLPGCCQYERKNVATEKMKCCTDEKCRKEANCCAGKDCCKDMKCGTAKAACCADEKCGKEANCCSGKECCKGKTCSKS